MKWLDCPARRVVISSTKTKQSYQYVEQGKAGWCYQYWDQHCFYIRIYTLDYGMESNCSKFVDNTKAGRAASILESRAATQRDLHRLEIWFDRNLSKVNKSKREILSPSTARTTLQTRGQPDEKQLCRKGPGDTSWQRVSSVPLLRIRPTLF